MKRDLGLTVTHLLDAQSINDTDTVSSILDTAGFNAAGILVNIGACTGMDADSKLLPVFQESDTTTGTDFTTVAAGDLIGAFTVMDLNTEDQVTQFVGYHGGKRYIRVNLDFTTGTGGITAGLLSVDGILGMPTLAPHAAVAAITAT